MREKIIKLAKKQHTLKSADLVAKFKISRQTATEYLRKLVADGLLIRTGITKNAVYGIPNPELKRQTTAVESLHLVKKLAALQEDKVYSEIELRLSLKRRLSENVQTIANYAFSEMLNNAIDHSLSTSATLDIYLKNGSWIFDIRDHGIGIFKRVQSAFKLESEIQAAEHLLKGKQTTMPSRHSGEGIFFTSRIADQFVIESHKIRLTIDNANDDVLLGETTFKKGTLVHFEIKCRSRKKLNDLFQKFSDDDFEFSQNEVRVRLRKTDAELMSRSQARRLLAGLEKFKDIVFDFTDVPGVGQAFADEIFRVYALQHPDKKLSAQHTNEIVQFMIGRVTKK